MRNSVVLKIFPTFTLVFAGYLNAGLCVSVLPLFLHKEQGFSNSVVGAVFGLQYAATLLTRNLAGRFGDKHGPRSAMQLGLALCGFGGVLLIGAYFAGQSPLVAVALVALMRLSVGWGESYLSTSGSTWGIARVGSQHSAQVIAWSGIGSYGSLAVGAPLGILIYRSTGLFGMGLALVAVAGAGFLLATFLRPAEMHYATLHPSLQILRRVAPYGVALALSAVGFSSLSSLVALYFDAQGWKNSPLMLTTYGSSFVAMRILYGSWGRRLPGLQIATGSLVLEACGLFLLARAPTARYAIAAACLIGIGSSLVFPLLGAAVIGLAGKSSRSTALGIYTAFIELSIGLTGATVGILSAHRGYRAVYAGSGICALAAAALCALLPSHSVTLDRG